MNCVDKPGGNHSRTVQKLTPLFSIWFDFQKNTLNLQANLLWWISISDSGGPVVQISRIYYDNIKILPQEVYLIPMGRRYSFHAVTKDAENALHLGKVSARLIHWYICHNARYRHQLWGMVNKVIERMFVSVAVSIQTVYVLVCFVLVGTMSLLSVT